MPDDFTTYAEARWPALVAFLVAEGTPRAQAEEEATAGLARARPQWRRVREDHDLDEQVLALVTGDADPGTARRFVDSLAAERDPGALPPRDAPVAEILDRARATRRRTAKRWAVAAVALVLVAAGAWWLTRPDPPDPDRVHRAENPLPVPWAFDGELHLAHVVVDTAPVSELLAVPGGVVYGDATGRVVLVDGRGDETPLGHFTPGAPLAGSQEQGMVAWVDPGDGRPTLHVYDVADRKTAATRVLAATGDRRLADGPYPIAVDQGIVYYAAPDGTFQWPLAGLGADGQVTSRLLDVANGAQVLQASRDELELFRSLMPILSLAGRGADLSTDGRRLLSYAPHAFFRPEAFDAVTGRRLDLGLPRGQYAVSSGFGGDGSIVLAVRHDANVHGPDDSLRLSSSGPILLVECRPGMHTPCETLTQLAGDAAYPPVFAQ